MKDIKSILKKIDVEEKTIEKIAIFLKTKRGLKFVSKLYTSPLKDLCNRYNCPKFVRLYNNDAKNMNLIKHVIKRENIEIPKTKVVSLNITVKKYPVRLTKAEMRKIDSLRPKKTMGQAERFHAYEEDKMAKYVALHPAPTDWQLKQDLFPQEMIDGYNRLLEAHREYVRDFIVSAYHRLSIIGRYKIADGKFVNRPLTSIKDINGGGHHINSISKEHPLLKKAQAIADEHYKQDNNLVCIQIKGHTSVGRLLTPHKIMPSIASAA